MSEDQRLLEVFSLWHQGFERGQEVSAGELCHHCPELAADLQRQIDAFRAMIRLVGVARTLGGLETTQDLPPGGAPARPAPPPGIPGYEVLGELGRGGMGIVYKARQLSLNRVVALKMILPGEYTGADELARFRREAEAVARLQNPHIVQIHEVGEHDHRPYFSLEFCGGGSLDRKLGGTPLPAHEAAALLEKLARAMHAAHVKGIVHRDLKPANVLLAEDGTPKITDFGLAKCLDEDAGQTRTGAVMGTPAYMSPEQALGQKEVGPLADVYALGAILYEMLTGLPPFKGATVLETLDQVRTREPVAVRLLQPKVPADVETVCLKCLDKDPRKRYSSAEALAQDLERWQKGEPIKARRSRAWERAYRLIRRNPVVSALATLAAVAFLGGFVVVALQLRQTQAALAEAKSSLYIQHVTLADREMQVGNTDRADMLLDLCLPPLLRHWEWHYLKRRCHADWHRLAGHTDLVRCVAYSADGLRLASGGNDGTVRVWDTATWRELLTLPHSGWVNGVVFEADGRRLVSASENGTVKVWDAADGRELRSLAPGYGFSLLTLSPDGRSFAMLQDKGLTVYDLETGRPTFAITGTTSHNKAVAFSPDGHLVVATLDPCLRIWEARTGQEVRVLPRPMPRGAYSLTFSPDGGRLYVSYAGDKYPALTIWDTTTGHEVPESLSTPLTVYAIALSSDGRSIATGGHEGVVKVRNTTTGKDLRAMRTFDGAVVALAFRPDGKGLAVAAGPEVWLRNWGVLKGQGATTPLGHTGGVTSVAFSPDGRRLASCGDNDQVKVWDVPTEQLVLSRTAPAPGYSVVVFSPDGQRVLATGRDGAVYSWDVDSGEPGPPLRIANSELTEAAFSPDGRRLATAGSDRVVRVWDAATGQEILTCAGHEAGVWGVRFSPDGRRLATAGGDGTVRLWDATTGREILTLRGHESYVQRVAFHPEGRLVASASTDETVRLWDVVAGREIAKLQGHTGPVRGLSFSSDGRRLASASEDGTVRLWDVATGQETLSLPDPGKVRWVTFSPDGWRLAAASSDGTIKIWDAMPLEN